MFVKRFRNQGLSAEEVSKKTTVTIQMDKEIMSGTNRMCAEAVQ